MKPLSPEMQKEFDKIMRHMRRWINRSVGQRYKRQWKGKK